MKTVEEIRSGIREWLLNNPQKATEEFRAENAEEIQRREKLKSKPARRNRKATTPRKARTRATGGEVKKTPQKPQETPSEEPESMWSFGDGEYDCIACGEIQSHALPFAQIMDGDKGVKHKVCYLCGASLLLLSDVHGQFHSFKPGGLSFRSPMMANRVRKVKWAVLCTMQMEGFKGVDRLLKMHEDGRKDELWKRIEQLNSKSARDLARKMALANKRKREL